MNNATPPPFYLKPQSSLDEERKSDLGDLRRKLKKVRFFLNGMKLPQPQIVPIRKKGITGSGAKLECHTNVSKLVHNYGGCDVRGYYISYDPEMKIFVFIPHSVWKTPEGKLIDATMNKRPEKCLTFIPLFKCKETTYLSRDAFYVSSKKVVIDYCDFSGKKTETAPKSAVRQGKLKIKDFWTCEKKSWIEMHPSVLERNSFSKPSLFTGKPFEMREKVA